MKNKKELKQCYIKPTRRVHDSGFRMFEVGYILEMDNKNRVKRKQVLTEYSDHIYQDYMNLVVGKNIYCLNFDLTMDGYIRIWSYDGQVVWEDMPMSSAELKFIPKLK
jgi:hypothetical protein